MLVEMTLAQAEYLIGELNNNKNKFHSSFEVEKLLSTFKRAIKKEADAHIRSIDKVIKQMTTSKTPDLEVLDSLKKHKGVINERSTKTQDKYFDRETGREKEEIGSKGQSYIENKMRKFIWEYWIKPWGGHL